MHAGADAEAHDSNNGRNETSAQLPSSLHAHQSASSSSAPSQEVWGAGSTGAGPVEANDEDMGILELDVEADDPELINELWPHLPPGCRNDADLLYELLMVQGVSPAVSKGKSQNDIPP